MLTHRADNGGVSKLIILKGTIVMKCKPFDINHLVDIFNCYPGIIWHREIFCWECDEKINTTLSWYQSGIKLLITFLSGEKSLFPKMSNWRFFLVDEFILKYLQQGYIKRYLLNGEGCWLVFLLLLILLPNLNIKGRFSIIPGCFQTQSTTETPPTCSFNLSLFVFATVSVLLHSGP